MLATSPVNVCSGFEKAGIFPFNHNAVQVGSAPTKEPKQAVGSKRKVRVVKLTVRGMGDKERMEGSSQSVIIDVARPKHHSILMKRKRVVVLVFRHRM